MHSNQPSRITQPLDSAPASDKLAAALAMVHLEHNPPKDVAAWLAAELYQSGFDYESTKATLEAMSDALQDASFLHVDATAATCAIFSAMRQVRPTRKLNGRANGHANGHRKPTFEEQRIRMLAPLARTASATDPDAAETAAVGGAVTTQLSTVQVKPVEWLWNQKIATGKITLVCGDPGLGKSIATLDIGARVSTGSPWPDDPLQQCREPATVILANAEDATDDTIAPRAIAAGADLTRIHVLEGVRRTGPDGKVIVKGFCLADVADLERSVIEHKPKLIIIDPVSAYLSDSDSHNNAEIRGLLAPLAKMAADHRVAVLMVTHLSKTGGARAMYRAMGSLAFIAAARAAWLVTKDKDDEKRRLWLPVKNNLGNDQLGLAFSLIGDGPQPHVAWERNPVEMKADDALAEEAGRDEEQKPERNEATDFLKELLANGSMPAAEVYEAARGAGVAKRTLDRAKSELGIRVKKNGLNGGWTWTLPGDHELVAAMRLVTDESEGCQPSSTNNVATFGTGGNLRDFDSANAVPPAVQGDVQTKVATGQSAKGEMESGII